MNQLVFIIGISIFVILLYKNRSKDKNRLKDKNRSKDNVKLEYSTIHGKGVFATKDFKKGDIIIFSLFPNNHKKERLHKNVSAKKFNEYITFMGKYVNHCSKNYNSKVISKDNILFQLIATKPIKKNQEITCNYDITHNKFPFISPSKEYYNSC